jgi:hypothetical protein
MIPGAYITLNLPLPSLEILVESSGSVFAEPITLRSIRKNNI